jgi:hypothetical protein
MFTENEVNFSLQLNGSFLFGPFIVFTEFFIWDSFWNQQLFLKNTLAFN